MNRKHFAIKDFCSNEEIQSILMYYENLDHSKEYSSDKALRKNMHYHNPDLQFLKDIIEPKLQSYFPNSIMSAGTFTNWIGEVELHTDSWQPGEDRSKKLGYAVLVPLQIKPEAIQTSTIVFDQFCELDETVSEKNITKDVKWNIAKYISKDFFENKILGKTKESLDKEFYKEFLSHIDYNYIENFASPTRYIWKAGDAIVWDRTLFHTGEKFSNSLNSKLHMIFLINFHS